MNDILDRALNTAQLEGASYAEARTVESRSQQLEVKNRQVSTLAEGESFGLGGVLDGKGRHPYLRG